MGKRDNLSGTQVRSAVGDQANGLSLPGRTLQNADDKGGRLNGVSATATAIGMGLALQSGSPDGLQAFAETLPEGDAPVPDAKAADKTPAAQDQTVLDADQDGGNATAHPFEIASLDVAAESAAVGDTTDAAAEPKMASLGAAPLHGSQDDQPYFKQSVKPGEDTDPTLHTPSSPKPEVSNDTPSSPPPMPVTDTLLGEDGVVDTVVDTLLGEDGVVDTVVDTLLGEDGVVDTVVDTLLGEDGVVDTVVDTLLGDDGVVDVVLGDDGIVDTILGDDGVVDTVIDTVLGDDGVVDVVLGDDGIVDTVLGDDGVVETVVDTVLGDDGVVDVVLGDDGIVDTILGDDGVVGTVVDTVLGDDGIVGTLVGGILGGITEDDSPDVLDDPVSVVVDSIDPLTDVVTDTVETVVDTTDDLIDTVSAPLETVVDTTDDLIDTVTAPLETVTDTTDDLIDTVSAPLETVTDTNDDLIETVSAPVETVVEDVTSGLTPLVEDLIGEDGILDGDDGFLDTLIGGDSPTSLLGFGGGGDSAEASVFGGLLGEEDIFGLDVDVDTDVGADDLFAGLSGDASLTGTLVDQGLFEDAASGDGAAPDPEIDDLLNDILAGGVEDVLGEQNTFNDLLDAAAPDGDGLLSDAEGSGLLVDNAVDDAMNTLFNTGGDAETSLLDGLFDSSSDNDAV